MDIIPKDVQIDNIPLFIYLKRYLDYSLDPLSLCSSLNIKKDLIRPVIVDLIHLIFLILPNPIPPWIHFHFNLFHHTPTCLPS